MKSSALSPKTLHFASPPRKTAAPASSESVERHQDTVDTATVSEPDWSLGRKIGMAAALAVTLGSQAANAAEQAMGQQTMIVEEVITPTEDDSVVTMLEQSEGSGEELSALDKLESFGDRVKEAKDSLVPDVLTERREKDLGDGWNLSFEPFDVDLRPRWDSGPALKLKGDFLETAIQKTEDIGDGWTTTRGIRGELRGEMSTYDNPELDLNLQAFKRWEGPMWEDYNARFDVGVGVRQRFVGEEHDEGLRAGVSFRQEIQGGGFEFRGADYEWYMEGRQNLYHNLNTGETVGDYRVMAGPMREFNVKLLGREGRISVAVGPELKGSTADGRDPFELGVKARVRTRF